MISKARNQVRVYSTAKMEINILETGPTIILEAKEYMLLALVKCSKALSKWVRRKAKAKCTWKMVTFTEEHTKTICVMDLVCISILARANSMRENGKTIRKMVMVSSFMHMEIGMRVTGLMIKDQVLAKSFTLMATYMKEIS